MPELTAIFSPMTAPPVVPLGWKTAQDRFPRPVGHADLLLGYAKGVHPALDVVFKLVGVIVGEFSGVHQRIGGNLTGRGRCADHRWLLAFQQCSQFAECGSEAIKTSGHRAAP